MPCSRTPGAHALLDVIPRLVLEDHRRDPGLVEQVREHQPGGPGADDPYLRAHAEPQTSDKWGGRPLARTLRESTRPRPPARLALRWRSARTGRSLTAPENIRLGANRDDTQRHVDPRRARRRRAPGPPERAPRRGRADQPLPARAPPRRRPALPGRPPRDPHDRQGGPRRRPAGAPAVRHQPHLPPRALHAPTPDQRYVWHHPARARHRRGLGLVAALLRDRLPSGRGGRRGHGRARAFLRPLRPVLGVVRGRERGRGDHRRARRHGLGPAPGDDARVRRDDARAARPATRCTSRAWPPRTTSPPRSAR